MTLSNINTDLHKKVSGYMLNIPVPKELYSLIQPIQDRFASQFADNLFIAPLESLHVTLMDWVAPLVEYSTPHDVLFKTHYEAYDLLITDILSHVRPISITFDTLRVSEGAIFLVGHDDGSFEHIRSEFITRSPLIAGTKQPPSIIHMSLARFIKQIPIEPLQAIAEHISVSFEMKVTSIRLARETEIPMTKLDLLKNYDLQE